MISAVDSILIHRYEPCSICFIVSVEAFHVHTACYQLHAIVHNCNVYNNGNVFNPSGM